MLHVITLTTLQILFDQILFKTKLLLGYVKLRGYLSIT